MRFSIAEKASGRSTAASSMTAPASQCAENRPARLMPRLKYMLFFALLETNLKSIIPNAAERMTSTAV